MSEHYKDNCFYGNDAKSNDTLGLKWGFNLSSELTKDEADSMLNCLRRELDQRGFYNGTMK